MIKNKKSIKFFLRAFILAMAFFPMFSFAATKTCNPQVGNIGDVICRIGSILNSIIPVLIALGVVYFVWGVITYMIGDEEEAKKKGRNRVIYGIIGLAIIVSMWGIVTLVIDTFGLDTAELARVTPTTNFSQTSTYVATPDICGTSYKKITKPILSDLINYVTCTISKSVVPLLFALATLMFIWGVVQYVINSDSEEKRKKGRDFMIWGIIALAVMVSVWGLVRIFGETFSIDYAVPQVKDH